MTLESGDFDFAGRIRLPLPKIFQEYQQSGKIGVGTLSPTSACLIPQ